MFLRPKLSPLWFDFFLFRKNPGFGNDSETERLKGAPVDFSRIRCPLCGWQPLASSRWSCSDSGAHFGCGTVWNTFETRGRCPGCNYRWQLTDCLRCARASLHEAWYRDEAD